MHVLNLKCYIGLRAARNNYSTERVVDGVEHVGGV